MSVFLVQALACGGVILVFLLARRLAHRLGNRPWTSPVLVAALVVGVALQVSGIDIAAFEAAAHPLRLALVPAIVALGAMIHRNRGMIAARPWPLLAAICGGTTVGVASAVGLAHAFGLGSLLTTALTTKTLSTPFAAAIAQRVGGPVPLSAALAALTGVIGALTVPPLLRLCRISGSAVIGVAIGQAAHLVGTDWLTRHDRRAAALSSVTMVLAGIFAALVLPLVWPWLQRLGA